MMKIWPGGNLSPLAKKELLYGTASFGYCIWLLGITFIDRLNSEKSHKTIDALAENMEKSQMSVWIYPEGTRNTKLELLPLKKGAFFLAIKAGVPIVSIVTSSYLNFFCKKENKWLPNGKVKVRVLPPVETKGMSIESVGDLANDLRERMQKEFELLNKEINLDEKYYKQK
jgi:1-acyl-sn-glycerol-3-phosphate acyltransferase